MVPPRGSVVLNLNVPSAHFASPALANQTMRLLQSFDWYYQEAGSAIKQKITSTDQTVYLLPDLPFEPWLSVGIVTLNQLKTQGFEVVDSAGLDHDQAMQILANHTRRGRGGRGSRIE